MGGHAGPAFSGMIAALLAFERLVTRAVTACACLLMAAAALVGFYQVFTRFVLEQPSTWSEVLTRTLLIWMVYLGVVGAFRAGALVSVDVLYNLTSGRARRLLEAVITAAELALLVIMFWWGVDMAYRVRFQNLAGLEISIAWAYAAIPVGAIFAIPAVIAHYFDPQRHELETAQ